MSIRLILADDHTIVREGLVAILSNAPDIEVVGEAGTGRDAIALAKQTQPDIAIIDLALPDIDGFEVIEHLHDVAPDTAVVLLTMHLSRQHVRRAFALGIRAYVLKESAGADLIEAVRAVYNGRRYISPALTDILLDLGEPSPLERLSKREYQVLVRVVQGKSSAAIARELHLSPKTVETYRSRIMDKLDIHDLPSLVKFAIQEGLISLD
nr:response regulator transcription factor [Ardenticatena sp.]